MSLNKEMLATIQKAGGAVFDANVQLKLAVKAYGERVHAGVGSNPYHLGNDALFENWKLVARLSQTMAGLEEALRRVYQVAIELNDDEPSAFTTIHALPAPDASAPSAVMDRVDKKETLAATDIKVRKPKTTTASRSAPTLPKGSPAEATTLPRNAVILLKHLSAVLTTTGFADLSQTKVAQATGIPLGSMTAAIKRLVADGHVVAGPNGQYKLAK